VSPLVVVRNVLKGWALLVGACAIFALVGWGLGGYRLLSIFVFCGALLAGALYWYSDRVALGLVRARELPLGESPGLHSTVERLAAVAGVMKPKLYLIQDGLPRALAAGRGPRGSAVAVSAGLLSAATPAELEAVLAHEFAAWLHRLADALIRLDQASELVSFQGSPATEPLYTINPFMEVGLAALFVTHPPVGERVRRLRELDPDWREKLRAA